MAHISDSMRSALHEAALKLGYPQVRQVQEEVVLAFLSGRDIFVSVPTGEGKSLCYAVLPWTVDLLPRRYSNDTGAPGCTRYTA